MPQLASHNHIMIAVHSIGAGHGYRITVRGTCYAYWACTKLYQNVIPQWTEQPNVLKKFVQIVWSLAKTMITQICAIKNGVDIYQNQGEGLVLCLVRLSSWQNGHFFYTTLYISFQRRSWAFWEVNQLNIKYMKLKTVAELSFCSVLCMGVFGPSLLV